MAAGSNTLYNPSDNSAPFMMLPEHVYGFVDLKTLADIHRYLRESGSEEDIDLADWVQENYLYEPIDQGGRTIRTPEGFSQLDRAYRRVRSLTNKAQDKWPFFDRNWKLMSSTTVRNNARGEAAPGVTYTSLPGVNSEVRALPRTNGFDASHAAPAPQLQVPFGTKQPGRHHAQKKDSPRPVQQTPVPLPFKKPAQATERSESEKQLVPPPKQPESQPEPAKRAQSDATSPQGLPKYADFFPELNGQAMPQPKLAHESEPEVARAASESSTSSSKAVSVAAVCDQPESSTEPDLEPARDAGGGKVRGPNGRYLPKSKPSPALATPDRMSGGGRVKHVQKGRTTQEKAATPEDDEPMSPALADNDSVIADVQSPSISAHQDELENENDLNGESVPASETDAPAATNVNSVVASTAAYMLAAEAEAVASNLDRLPPSFARRPNKRKSESIAPSQPQPDQRKRGRFGGIVGRPRKSDQRVEQVPVSPQKGASATDTGVGPKMTTRRSTRRSAAANPDPSAPNQTEDIQATPTKSSADHTENIPAASNSIAVHMPENQRKEVESQDDDEDEPMVDIDVTDVQEGDTTAGAPGPSKSTTESRSSSPLSSGLNQLQASDSDLLAIGLSKTSSPAQPRQPVVPPPAVMLQAAKPPTNNPSNGAATNGVAPAHSPGHVQYFARIHTFTGTMDIPIPSEKLDDAEDELIQKYAEWMAKEGGTDIPFKQFRSIFGFAKKG